jgi:hypothetical protein
MADEAMMALPLGKGKLEYTPKAYLQYLEQLRTKCLSKLCSKGNNFGNKVHVWDGGGLYTLDDVYVYPLPLKGIWMTLPPHLSS